MTSILPCPGELTFMSSFVSITSLWYLKYYIIFWVDYMCDIPVALKMWPTILDFLADVQMEKYGELSINIVSLCAQNLLSHPFIVVRRQCQVTIFHNNAEYFLLLIFNVQFFKSLSISYQSVFKFQCNSLWQRIRIPQFPLSIALSCLSWYAGNIAA